MLTSYRSRKPHSLQIRFLLTVLFAPVCGSTSISLAQTNTTQPTTITVDDIAKLTTAKRLGVNLGTQDFYDSGQFMRNLAFINPGFEAESWQSILHCQSVTANSCTDDNLYTYWPANFLRGATAEFIVGAAKGTTATVASSTAATIGKVGVTAQFSSLPVSPTVGDYLVVRFQIPGNAAAGWWTETSNGASFATETTDLSPHSPGKQALSINASGTTQRATLNSYMDSTPGRSFLQLKGAYTLTFRGKGTGGSNKVAISLSRAVSTNPALTFFNDTVQLTDSWQDYSFTFEANDTGRVGTLGLTFLLSGSSMLIDDVALTAAAASDNPTVYRNEVFYTLRNLHPGILRYMDSGTDWGSSLDNMLAPDFARERAGYSNRNSEADQIPLSLPDFLVLCKAIGAEPWYTMQTGMSTEEMSNLMDYLGGSTSTIYGAKRAAMGQTAAWTIVFPKIHLEFGNEVWNTSNPGATMNDPTSYGKRAAEIFAAAKASPSYAAKSFDLILDGFQAVPAWTKSALAASSNYDTVDVAAYLFNTFNDASSIEKIYGPMFAEPESIDSVPGGLMQQQAAVAAAAHIPARLAVYEANMGTTQGSATESQLETAIPSLGAGLTTADNMLLLMRDLGVTEENMFAIPGLSAPFAGTNGSTATTSPIWGMVIDMGGPTNLLRPTYLSEQLANSAILPTLLHTSQSGTNPTWNQPFTTNDSFSLTGAHYIQSFAFTDGIKLNLILFNLSRTSALPVVFAGLNAPVGTAAVSTLTASSITSSNESQGNVEIRNTAMSLMPGVTLSLPPFSMTVVSVAAPVIPATVTSVALTCTHASLSPGQSANCSATVAGTGKFNPAAKLSVDQGTISSAGVYTAPASEPASGKATVTATSVGDTTKHTTYTISIAADTITKVTASCKAIGVTQGGVLNCTAIVTGTGGFQPGYTWSASVGSIDSAGNFTAPVTGTLATVTATSIQDHTKSASVTVALFPALIISKPKATVTSTTATISWSLNSAAHSGITYGTTTSLGSTTPYNAQTSNTPSITLTGLKPSTTYYMVLFSFNSNQSVTESYTIKTASSSSTVTKVSVTCKASSLAPGSTTTCAAPVQGTGSYSSGVTWSASSGKIDSNGNLTAPASGTTVTVKATSLQNPNVFGVVTIPVVSGLAMGSVTATATSTTATVKWTTNLASHSGISYGLSTSYSLGTTPYASTSTTSPSLTLSGLKPGTTYYLYLFSIDSSQTVSKQMTVTTAKQ